MKIIDLLNKIAKGEEVPKKMFLYNYVWFFNKEEKDYFNSDNTELFGSYLEYAITTSLNDEVEIIEEEKEIEKGIKPYKQYVEELGKDGYGISEINEEYLDRLSKIVIELINDMRDKE